MHLLYRTLVTSQSLIGFTIINEHNENICSTKPAPHCVNIIPWLKYYWKGKQYNVTLLIIIISKIIFIINLCVFELTDAVKLNFECRNYYCGWNHEYGSWTYNGFQMFAEWEMLVPGYASCNQLRTSKWPNNIPLFMTIFCLLCFTQDGEHSPPQVSNHIVICIWNSFLLHCVIWYCPLVRCKFL